MKKALYICCAAALLAAVLAGCEKSAEKPSEPAVTQSAAPTPTPTPPIPFTDVAQHSPYYDAVVWAYQNGIASDGETFGPADACTRGQVITFIWRAMGSPKPQITENPISDIAPSNWFYEPVLWAYESGISTSSTFKPNSPCTNGEALTFLWRAEGKPMAALGSSAIALAAPNQYFTRPVAWAETNGLLSAEVGFNPSANCLRADLMSYLYWAEGQRASAKESRALQEEYEQIINNAWIYDVHGSGLLYADYVDVDIDGKLELLTVGIDDISNGQVTATVYADADGHAKKSCEGSFEAFAGKMSALSLCRADGSLYLRSSGFNNYGWGHDGSDDYFKLERGAVTHGDRLFMEEAYQDKTDTVEYTYTVSGKKVTEDEYQAVLNKYGDETLLYNLDFGHLSISDRGLVPSPKSLRIAVNGSVVPRSDSSYLLDGDIMVPLGDVLEAMGVAVYVNPDASVILASTKSDTLVISRDGNFRWSSYSGIDSRYYGKSEIYKYSMNDGNSQELALQTDINSIIWAPLQTIVSAFGAKAEWNGATETIQITSNIPDSNRMSQDELKTLLNFDFEQANQLAINNGCKGSDAMNGTASLFENAFSFDTGEDMASGLRFINGKAVWTLYAVGYEEFYQYGHFAELYRVDVASDGTVTAYPDEKGWMGAGQI